MPNPSHEPPMPSKAPDEDLKDMDVLCTFKIKIESQNLDQKCTKDHCPYPSQDPNAKPQSGTLSILKIPNNDVLCTFKIKREKAKIQNIGALKTCDHIQIKIKILNPSQEPQASFKAPNQDLKDMDVLCTPKI